MKHVITGRKRWTDYKHIQNKKYTLSQLLINPLPTDDAFWHRQILAACYQLAQSVLKIGSVLAERVGQGEVGVSTAMPDSAWWRLQLPAEKPWSMTVGPFVCFRKSAHGLTAVTIVEIMEEFI